MKTTWSTPFRYAAGIGLVALGIYVLVLSRPVLPLLVVAAVLAALLRPLILWLQRSAHLPRVLAVLVVYLLAFILVPLLLLLVVPAIINAVEYVIGLDYAAILQDLKEWYTGWLISLRDMQLPIQALDDYLEQTANSLLELVEGTGTVTGIQVPSLERILGSMGSALAGTFGAATQLVGSVLSQGASLAFMYLASIYISLDAHTYAKSLLRITPEAYREEISTLLRRISVIWSKYFRGELTLMVVIGLLSWIGLTALGVPGAPYLAIVAGLLELIPNLGPIIATIPAVIVALLNGSSYLDLSPLAMAGVVVLLYLVIQQLENNLIVPRVLGEAVGLPALVVMTGVVVGTSVAGILGALLVTPLIATAREIILYTYRKILAEEPFPEQAGVSEKLPQPLSLELVLKRMDERWKQLGALQLKLSELLPKREALKEPETGRAASDGMLAGDGKAAEDGLPAESGAPAEADAPVGAGVPGTAGQAGEAVEPDEIKEE